MRDRWRRAPPPRRESRPKASKKRPRRGKSGAAASPADRRGWYRGLGDKPVRLNLTHATIVPDCDRGLKKLRRFGGFYRRLRCRRQNTLSHVVVGLDPAISGRRRDTWVKSTNDAMLTCFSRKTVWSPDPEASPVATLPFRRPGTGRDSPISRSIIGRVDAGRSLSSGRPSAGPGGRHDDNRG